MWLIILVLLAGVCLHAQADFSNPAPGIVSWCNYTEPDYVPDHSTRISRGSRGAWACVGPYGNVPLPTRPDYAGCPTADSWGTDVGQCAVPGYSPMKRLTYPDPLNATVKPGFPATYDQRDVCNQNVYSAPLVDMVGNEYGSVDIFKDYDDVLHITCTLWALTNWTPHGQWLHSQPAQPSFYSNLMTPHTTPYAGAVYVSDSFNPSLPTAYNNQLVPGTVSRFWSCWTYTIDLKQTCNPENSGHWVTGPNASGTGCRPHGNKGGPLTLDLAQPSTPNLYVHLSFSIVRMDLNELDSSYGYQCGQPQGYATVGLPGSGIIDLYNLPSGQQSFAKSCSSIQNMPPSPPLPPSPPPLPSSPSPPPAPSPPPDPPAPPPSPPPQPPPPAPPTTLIYSNFYFNTSGRSFDRAQDCEVIDRLMAVYLRGRSYVRIACDVTSASGRWSVLYYNLRFTSTADRDFLFYTITTAYFWNDMLYPNLQPGCGFFGTYSQTDDNLVFKDPNFATPPSVPPFQNNIDTANPYFTVCTAYIAPNTSIPASSLSSYPPGIFGWAPPQQPAGIDPFTLGSTGGLAGTQNLGINSASGYGPLAPYITMCSLVLGGLQPCPPPPPAPSPPPPPPQPPRPPRPPPSPPPPAPPPSPSPPNPPPAPPTPPPSPNPPPPPPPVCTILISLTKVFTATSDPFNVNTDPKRVIQNLNLLYSSPDVRPAYSFTSLFQETGNPTPSLVQALALVFSPEDMQAFIRAFTGSTNTLKVMASGFYLQCTDYVKVDFYGCGFVKPIIYSGLADTPANATQELPACASPPPNPPPPPPPPPAPPSPPPHPGPSSPPPPTPRPSPSPPSPSPPPPPTGNVQISIAGPSVRCYGGEDAYTNTLLRLIISAGLQPELLVALCTDFQDGAIITATFISIDAAQAMYRFLYIPGNTIIITTYILTAEIPCGSSLTISREGGDGPTFFQCGGPSVSNNIRLSQLCCAPTTLSPPPSPTARSPPPPTVRSPPPQTSPKRVSIKRKKSPPPPPPRRQPPPPSPAPPPPPSPPPPSPSTPSATFNRYQLYVKTPIYDSVSAANIKTYECPPLRDALSDVLIRRGVSLQTAYPPSSESENGCSIITATNEYVYYKVFFTLEESTWAFLKSSIGLANNQFIATARIMCSSEVSFALDNGVVELTLSGQNLYGLQQRAPMCKLDVLLP